MLVRLGKQVVQMQDVVNKEYNQCKVEQFDRPVRDKTEGESRERRIRCLTGC